MSVQNALAQQDVVAKFFAFLDVRSAARTSRVCSLWRDVQNGLINSAFWKAACAARGIASPLAGKTWKQTFFTVANNWRQGRYVTRTVSVPQIPQVNSLRFQSLKLERDGLWREEKHDNRTVSVRLSDNHSLEYRSSPTCHHPSNGSPFIQVFESRVVILETHCIQVLDRKTGRLMIDVEHNLGNSFKLIDCNQDYLLILTDTHVKIIDLKTELSLIDKEIPNLQKFSFTASCHLLTPNCIAIVESGSISRIDIDRLSSSLENAICTFKGTLNKPIRDSILFVNEQNQVQRIYADRVETLFTVTFPKRYSVYECSVFDNILAINFRNDGLGITANEVQVWDLNAKRCLFTTNFYTFNRRNLQINGTQLLLEACPTELGQRPPNQYQALDFNVNHNYIQVQNVVSTVTFNLQAYKIHIVGVAVIAFLVGLYKYTR